MTFQSTTNLLNKHEEVKIEKEDNQSYENKSYDHFFKYSNRIFKTTQNNIVIPTGDLMRDKKSDLRIVACLSAMSYVANYYIEGSNTRYIDEMKACKKIGLMCKYLNITPKKLKDQVNYMIRLNTSEFEQERYVDQDDRKQGTLIINYTKGKFITLPYDTFEYITNKLSNRAFKTYCNLRWICFDIYTKSFVERVVTQEYLLGLMGLSTNSKRAMREITNELIQLELISIRKTYIHDHKLIGRGETKEAIYYSILEL